MKIVSVEELRRASLEVLHVAGVPKEDARIVADHLVEANLRGCDSHGVLIRLPRLVKGIRSGAINPSSSVKVIRETSATTLLDGGQGIGQVVSMKAVDIAVEKARDVGVGVVSLRRCSHIGFLGYYSEHVARQGMVGITFTNTEPAMAPTGGAEPIFGTNPIAIGIPTKDYPILIDMSTSVVARGKIIDYMNKGLKIEKGWAIDREGKVTEDPEEALKGALLPIGGPKGYCLALGFDILTGALAGASVGKDVRGTLHAEEVCTKGDLFIAINPDMFCGLEAFMNGVERLKKQIKGCRKAPGVDMIYLPGDPEMITREKRMGEGVPVDEKSWSDLKALKASPVKK